MNRVCDNCGCEPVCFYYNIFRTKGCRYWKPNGDVVSVVKCLECRHSDTQCHKDRLRYCMRPIKADDYNETGYIYPLEVVVKDDDFCSYGEVNRS